MEVLIMKRFKILCLSMGLAVLSTMPVYAQWEQTGTTWKYENEGSYLSNTWAWIDGNNDGISECYYFGADGLMLSSSITPDNYMVNENGAWTVDGVVQTKTTGNVSSNKQSKYYHDDETPDINNIVDGLLAGDPDASQIADGIDAGDGGYGNHDWN